MLNTGISVGRLPRAARFVVVVVGGGGGGGGSGGSGGEQENNDLPSSLFPLPPSPLILGFV